MLHRMVGIKLKIYFRVSWFSVYPHYDISIISCGNRVQKVKTVVFLKFDGETYIRFDAIELVMKFLYMLSVKACVAVIHVSKPPTWRGWSGGNSCFLKIFHYKVCNSCANGRTHGATQDLFVIMAFVGEITLTE